MRPLRHIRQMISPSTEVPTVDLPALKPLPRTRGQLTATASSHDRIGQRADRVLALTSVLDDFRAMDAHLHKKG